MNKTALAFAAFAMLTLPTARPVRADDSARILARVKEATGGAAWDGVRSLHTKARISTGGLEGPVESWEDVRTGRSVTTFKLGPVQGAEGYDGKEKWSQDASGQTRAEEGGDAREGTVNEAYRRMLAYWYPERAKAQVTRLEDKADGGRTFQIVRIVPEGGRAFDVWVDPGTWRIDRIVEKTATATAATILSDYREVDGLLLPFSSRMTTGDAKYDQVVAVESIEVNPALDEARFRRPEGKSNDFAIAGGKSAETVPFRLLNNHIYIQVRLNGTPLQFLFDTGGVNVLTPEAARKLELKSEGSLEMRGVGEKSADTSLARVSEVAIGDLTLRDQVFFVVPLTGVDQAEGMRVDGIVGYELIKRFIARVEYARERLTFTLPAAFQEPAGAAALPITFDGGTPQVQGELDGIPGTFTIDTGSRNSLSVNGPFAQEHGLAAKNPKSFEAMSGWGVGGGTRSRIARARKLKLGGVAIPSPVIDIALGEKGALANRYLAGNVGGGVLRRFDVTFDYDRKRMYLEPNADFAKPDAWDRAGLWLNGEEDAFKVMDVVKDGPAAQAGLQPGDEVLAIDGRSTKELSLPEVRTRFRTLAPGTKVELEVRSGGRVKKVQVVLRELV